MSAIGWAEKAKDISIIDHIAIQAMVGLLSSKSVNPYIASEHHELSKLSYQIAWEMCKEGGFDE